MENQSFKLTFILKKLENGEVEGQIAQFPSIALKRCSSESEFIKNSIEIWASKLTTISDHFEEGKTEIDEQKVASELGIVMKVVSFQYTYDV